MSKPLAGGVLIACGLALHLIEPVSILECSRPGPGPAACTIRRTFFHVLPYATTQVPGAAALVVEPERLGRADPQAVTCTSLSLMDDQGDATPFACLKDTEALGRVQRFFDHGSGESALRVACFEPLVLAVSGAVTLAGLLLLSWAAVGRRRSAAPLPRPPSGRARS
jgi:hypothetical protein